MAEEVTRNKHVHYWFNDEIIPPSKLPVGIYNVTVTQVEVTEEDVVLTHYLSWQRTS